MTNYKVSFFKRTDDGYEFLGAVTLDDWGTGPALSVTGKAYRQCADVCFLATKVVVERI
jgi:hypothetical protein